MDNEPKPVKVLEPRHSRLVRITHWTNVISLFLLLMSGLQIFNAHPALYWGQASRFDAPWLAMTAAERADGGLVGRTKVGGATFVTTGVFGASFSSGAVVPRGFPAAVTLPGPRNLAVARNWHFFFAWLFAINGVIFVGGNLLNGHLKRDLLPTKAQLAPRHIWRDIIEHAQLKFPKGPEARHYNVIQKFAYLAVIAILLPGMILSGMTMSPSLDATFPWLLDLFGGRQSARSIHFIFAMGLVAFIVVHVVMVVLSGFWNNIRSMITGRYAIELPAPPAAAQGEAT